jgi:hypothetical protein
MPARIIYPGIDGPETYRRSKSLAEDLARLAVGQQPTAGDLSAAPIIDDWTIADRQESALAGLISGHPVLGTRPGITSSVFALDLDHGWARTWSRWYRLGKKSVRGQQ